MVAAMGRPESQSQKHTLYNGLIVDKTTAMTASQASLSLSLSLCVLDLSLTPAMTASQAILAALYARDVRNKGGQHIELSMYDVGFAFNWVDLFVRTPSHLLYCTVA